MRKLLIAAAAAATAGVLALGACTDPASQTDSAQAAADGATDASAGAGRSATGGGDMSAGAASADTVGSDASADGSMPGDTASQPVPPPASPSDPMVTGQGSTGAEGRVQMPSEPAHPARQ